MNTLKWLEKEGYPLTMPMTITNLANIIDRFNSQSKQKSEPLPDSRFTWGNIEQAYIIGVINNGRSLIENFPQEVENHKKQLELLKKWFKDNVAAASTVSEAGEDAIGFADFIESNEFFKLENGLWDSSSIYPMSAALNLTTEQLYQLYKQSKQ